jgi:hypothetical protein
LATERYNVPRQEGRENEKYLISEYLYIVYYMDHNYSYYSTLSVVFIYNCFRNFSLRKISIVFCLTTLKKFFGQFFAKNINKSIFFSLLVLEGVIIDSRTEPRRRISLLLVNTFSLLTSGQPSPSNERFSLISLINVDRRFSIFIATVEK